MNLRVENQYIEAEIECISNTILLDRSKKNRSFQNCGITYRQLINQVTKGYGETEFYLNQELDCVINYPVIQYDETDWEFVKRLATHFNTVLYPGYMNQELLFYIGCKKGKNKEFQQETVSFSRYGLSEKYFTQGGLENGKSRDDAVYIEVMCNNNWDIGDIISYDKMKYTVCRKNIFFNKGELQFGYLLGRDYFLYRRKAVNKKLSGVCLKGEVKGTEKVFIQLEIDKEKNAEYPWSFMPETGNLSYCMPETGTKTILYFPSGDEKEGMVLYTMRTNQESSIFTDTQNREFHTFHDKKIGLYTDKLFMEGKEKDSSVYLEDGASVRLTSGKSINMKAAEGIFINGKKGTLSAPNEIVCRTNKANIEINRDFNFYAPEGVQTIGSGTATSAMTVAASKGSTSDHWQMSYTAIAAIPAVDFKGGW